MKRYLRTVASHVLFERPALHNLRIKHLGTDFADKQVLINNLEDVAGFLLEIDLSVRYMYSLSWL